MRTLILSLAILGTIAVAEGRAAPVMQPATAAIATLDQSSVQPVQFAYSRREIRRREEIRRRREYNRRRAARRAYRRGY